ncbi:hypothetical protein AMECASPLE_008642 [Ameca splendens]|uniref:Uncharacterized protein n=1 Tax=Ameca splendens TaxID=208324 RepID=A0ABV0YB08_9TELE
MAIVFCQRAFKWDHLRMVQSEMETKQCNKLQRESETETTVPRNATKAQLQREHPHGTTEGTEWDGLATCPGRTLS